MTEYSLLTLGSYVVMGEKMKFTPYCLSNESFLAMPMEGLSNAMVSNLFIELGDLIITSIGEEAYQF